MNTYNIIIFFTIVITIVLHLYCYKELSNKKSFNLNLFKIIVLFISVILITINHILNKGVIMPIFTFFGLLVCDYIVYRDNYFELITNSSIGYLLIIINEIILSFILVILKICDLNSFDSKIILKLIFSIITVVLAYFECKLKFIKKLSNRFSKLFANSKVSILMLFLAIFIPIIIDYSYLNTINSLSYIINIILLIVFEILIIFIIFNEIKLYKEMQKHESLLSFINKYEKIIDEQRINKHEMHNNLLILKSYKNKNSKEYNETLDYMIKAYSSSEITINNMDKLPNGIKGILYYKFFNLEKYNIKLNLHISKNLKLSIEKRNNKEYINLCKIIGIVIDNAIEAARDSKLKIINIDIYKEENKIIFSIINSFSKKINIDELENIYYSTKGKERGLGLFFARNLLNQSENISMNQFIENNLFVTEIVVNN